MRPTPLALNKPIRIFGYPPKALTLVLVFVAVGIMLPVSKLLIAGIGLVALIAIRYFASDPVGLLIWLRAFFQCAQYSPNQRKVFKLEIK